jgi:hypothetical protein
MKSRQRKTRRNRRSRRGGDFSAFGYGTKSFEKNRQNCREYFDNYNINSIKFNGVDYTYNDCSDTTPNSIIYKARFPGKERFGKGISQAKEGEIARAVSVEAPIMTLEKNKIVYKN